jgi:hypothetical protein
MLKDENEKKKVSTIQKDWKQSITIKRIRIKIEIQNTNNFLIERWDWKEKSIWPKAQKTIKRMRTKLKQKTYHKLRLEDKVEKKIKVLQKGQK